MADKELQVGDLAPDFSTIDDTGHPVSLKEFRGKTVILYFYPKDDTPGCTIEAKKFRDYSKEFESKNAVILGVSFDDQASHEKFKEKHELPFRLLVDADKKIAKAYGSGGLLFPSRHTFVIDGKGRIKKIYRKVSPAEHAEEILNEI
ncbi:MAG: peroxiredoxin [Deltaproteobacteria bacterium]|nr:peroxiredoxin [Deltaproteobacteria bacterium]